MFSNQFLVAALLRVINAPTLQQARAAKEILMNELGVIYRRSRAAAERPRGRSTTRRRTARATPSWSAPRGRSTAASSASGRPTSSGCWPSAEGLGLGFDDMGKRQHGRPSTLHFCDELQRLYGSEDAQFAEGASFAVENWAAAGFWQELEDGLMRIKQARHPAAAARLLHLAQPRRGPARRAHAWRSSRTSTSIPASTATKFFRGGREVLDAIAAFWDGLEEDRLNRLDDSVRVASIPLDG